MPLDLRNSVIIHLFLTLVYAENDIMLIIVSVTVEFGYTHHEKQNILTPDG